MSRGPRRLKDDPDFQWETGCNLADEALLTQGYDLSGLRQAVLAKVPEVGDGVPPIRPRRAWRWWLGGFVGVSTTLTAFWLGTQFATSPTDGPRALPEAPLRAEPLSPVAPPVDAVPREEVPEASPGSPVEAPAAPPASRPPVAPAVTPEPGADADAPVETDDGVASLPEPVADEPARAPSHLAAELAVYEPAADALEAGDTKTALQGFRDYLDRFPAGTLRVEAELGLLGALHRQGDAARPERWAAQLIERPDQAANRDAIRELRAQALVRLGRCDEALASVEGLPSRVVGPIRRTCRRR